MPYCRCYMTSNKDTQKDSADVPVGKPAAVIYRVDIERFRGIKNASWLPARGVNIILGGGDVGKSTLLDAIALLLSPTNSVAVSDTDYYLRDVANGFAIEAVFSIPSAAVADSTLKPAWPWDWDGKNAVIPGGEGTPESASEPVYRLRVRGTPELELAFEIVQPNDEADHLPVSLRRAIGLVRLGGDDRNDRDLRLVSGSALDRLLSDSSLRSRMASELAKADVKQQLLDDGREALTKLDGSFRQHQLPNDLDLSVVGGQGASIAALVGLTARRETAQLPMSAWGSGTRRLAALAIAEQNQSQAPITVVDELERGLEAYRQHSLVQRLQNGRSQAFVTTHSPFTIAAASKSSFWYASANGCIGPLASSKIDRHRTGDPRTFLSRLAVIAEGKTEQGFLYGLLERALGGKLQSFGVHVSDGGGNEKTLELLEAFCDGGLRFAGFADNENKFPARWKAVGDSLGALLFRWELGCIEDNIIGAVPEKHLRALIDDGGDRRGQRLRSLAERLSISEASFDAISAKAGQQLRNTIVAAAKGTVPDAIKEEEASHFRAHEKIWFKSWAGGNELCEKMFTLEAWPTLRTRLLAFCNEILTTLGQPVVSDLKR